MSLYVRKKYIKIGVGLILAGVLLWSYGTRDFSKYMDIDEMRVLMDSFGPYGPLVFIGLCIAGAFLPLPELILIPLGGLLFGGVKAFIY